MNGNHEEVAKAKVEKEMEEFLHELRSKVCYIIKISKHLLEALIHSLCE